MLRSKQDSFKISTQRLQRNVKYIFLDLEFDRYTQDSSFHEINSIGAVKCDSNFKVVDCFQISVRPRSVNSTSTLFSENEEYIYLNNKMKKISKYGIDLKLALDKLQAWISGSSKPHIYTWSNSDRKIMLSNIRRYKLRKDYTPLLQRFKDIQPEVSEYVKILDIPINKNISLDNMKKIFGFKQDVKHDSLLDSIDLCKVFKKYINQASIDKKYLCKVSYRYRHVKLTNRLNSKVYFKGDLRFKATTNNINQNLANSILKTLEKTKFTFSKSAPSFFIDRNKNELVLNKTLKQVDCSAINTTLESSSFKLDIENLTIMTGNNENSHLINIEKNISDNILKILKRESSLSKLIYQDIKLNTKESEVINALNNCLKHKKANYNNKAISAYVDSESLQVLRSQDKNQICISKSECELKIRAFSDKYILKINSIHHFKNESYSKEFLIEKTSDTYGLISDIIQGSKKREFLPNEQVEVNSSIKKCLKEVITNKELLTKKSKDIFFDDNKITILYNRKIVGIKLDSTKIHIYKKGNNNYISFIDTIYNKSHDFIFRKTRKPSNSMNKLLETYKKQSARTFILQDLDENSLEALSKLKTMDEFKNNNSYLISYNEEHDKFIFIEKTLKNKVKKETYNLYDFDVYASIDKEYNLKVSFYRKTNNKKAFLYCTNCEIDNINLILNLFKSNSNIDEKTKIYTVKHFSKELLKTLQFLLEHKYISTTDDYNELYINEDSIKLKKIHFNKVSSKINEISSSIEIYKKVAIIKLESNKFLISYCIPINSLDDNYHIKDLYKNFKKEKSNSWVKIFGINRKIRNSIWRIIENSKIEGENFNLTLDKKYLKACGNKYFYDNTDLALKRVSDEKLTIKIGKDNITSYDIKINKKNEFLIDDLINNTLLYENLGKKSAY